MNGPQLGRFDPFIFDRLKFFEVQKKSAAGLRTGLKHIAGRMDAQSDVWKAVPRADATRFALDGSLLAECSMWPRVRWTGPPILSRISQQRNPIHTTRATRARVNRLQ